MLIFLSFTTEAFILKTSDYISNNAKSFIFRYVYCYKVIYTGTCHLKLQCHYLLLYQNTNNMNSNSNAQ